jgi:hypothetical protein
MKKINLYLSEPLLVRTFNLERTYEMSDLLQNWFDADFKLTQNEEETLKKVCHKLLENADFWNEEELKMHFISILVFLADYTKPLRVFFDREISAKINDTLLKTEADMLVSKGFGNVIEIPYFFLHEFKREKKYSGDPIGQMLAGMLIAQAKNDNQKQPVYGSYVQGRFWFFSILTDQNYVVSQPLNAANYNESYKIVSMLKFIKELYN